MSTSSLAHWQAFKWGTVELNSEVIKKGAILLPVKLDGMDCDMQLDTGVGVSVLYRNALPSRYSHLLNSETLLIKQFSLAEPSSRIFQLMYARKKSLSKKCGVTKNNSLVGTLANDYFLDGSLSLDLGRGLFRYEKAPFQPLNDKEYFSFEIEISKIESHGSFPIAMVTLENGEKKKVIFDTGSVSASLVVLQERDWLKLVGLEKIDDVKPKLIPRWGQLIPCYSAPIGQSASMENFKFSPETKAVYCHDLRANPNVENPIFGVIGLAPFSDHAITIDYLSRKIFIEKEIAKKNSS